MTLRYLVFAGYVYYPNGGWGDFKVAMGDLKSAIKFCQESNDTEWWHIVDLKTGQIVRKRGN